MLPIPRDKRRMRLFQRWAKPIHPAQVQIRLLKQLRERAIRRLPFQDDRPRPPDQIGKRLTKPFKPVQTLLRHRILAQMIHMRRRHQEKGIGPFRRFKLPARHHRRRRHG